MGRLTVSAVPVLNDNYVWLIRDPDSGETAAVDPSVAQPVLDATAAEQLRITQVLNTHWHPDHTGGNDGIRDATGCTITAPAEAERVSRIDRIVSEGARVTVAGAEAVVWDIPAHTSGHIAYYFEDEDMIFVGDTMFAMGCGRLFEGTAEQMYANMQRIAALQAMSASIAATNIRWRTRALRPTPSRESRHRAPTRRCCGTARARAHYPANDGCRGTGDQPLRSSP